MALFRGARPTSREKIAGATPHKILGTTPPQFIRIPKTPLSMWGNDQFGDCVTAEECFAKACDNVNLGYHKAVKWARQHWALNGAGLWEIMTIMQSKGIYNGEFLYNDGPFKYVDYTDADTLQNAIVRGPVKIGVAADQLENVPGVGIANGWIATGFTEDTNLDHCTSLCGYGSFSWLAAQLKCALPNGIKPTKMGYALFTWSTIGIIDVESMQNITGEAWVRNPTTVIKPNPGSGI